MPRSPAVSRTAALLAGTSVSVLVVACSAGSQATALSGVSTKATGPVGTASVSGAFGTAPTITVEGSNPPTTTKVTVISRGTGRVLQTGDLAVVDDYGRTWRSTDSFQSTFDAATPPDTLPVGTGKLGLPGLDKALVGVPSGSRVLVVLPPADGFGNVTSLPTGVKNTDTALLVFDIRGGFPGNAGVTGTPTASTNTALPAVSGQPNAKPTITIPKVTAPTALSVTTVIAGSGPVVAKGDELVVQYVGQIWASGKEFDSSWSRSTPVGFTIGAGQLIPAWDTGLVGVKVGSRVLIVAPPASGYGSAGQASAGISGTDTLVFVVDVLGSYPS